MVSSDRDTKVETEDNLPTADAMSEAVAFNELWSRFPLKPLKHRVISSHIKR